MIASVSVSRIGNVSYSNCVYVCVAELSILLCQTYLCTLKYYSCSFLLGDFSCNKSNFQHGLQGKNLLKHGPSQWRLLIALALLQENLIHYLVLFVCPICLMFPCLARSLPWSAWMKRFVSRLWVTPSCTALLASHVNIACVMLCVTVNGPKL